jgi:hypothetical protein
METRAMAVGGSTVQGNAAGAAAPSTLSTMRSNAVIILERDGSLVRCGPKPHPPEPTSGYVELSANAVQQQHTLIDRVLNFAFDTLGLTTLELKVREQD